MTERKNLFYVLSLLGFIISFILILKTNGETFRSFFYYGHDYFMDFFNHIWYVRDRAHVYDSSIYASFPPLAYVLYYFLGKFIPASAVEGPGNRAVRDNLFGLNLYVAYTAVLVVALVFLVQYFLREKKRQEQCLLLFIILLSAPFIGLYERGNSAFIVLLLLFGFTALKDSKEAWKREAAILLLAVAAGLKLYPAVFGLLYLQERRWKEAARLTVYGLFLVFFPFIFFGGFGKIPVLLYNLKAISNEIVLGDLRSATYATVFIGQKMGMSLPFLLAAGRVVSVLFFLLSCGCVLLQKVLWKKMVLLSGIMIFFPVWSGSYTLIYLTLPLVLFLAEKKEEVTGFDILYQVFFACVFTILLWNTEWLEDFFNSDFSYSLRAVGSWGLVLTVMAETFFRRSRGGQRE